MMSSEKLYSTLRNELFFGMPESQDLGDVIALLAMICKLTNSFKQKKPGITHYQTIRLCTKSVPVDDSVVERIAVLCDFLAEGCVKFPDLGVPAKEMPSKIKDLIFNLRPF